MMPINTFFGMMIILFGLMGALRGWEKETLVVLSGVTVLFVRVVLVSFVPKLPVIGALVGAWVLGMSPTTQFYFFSGLTLFMAIAGYAGPVLSSRWVPKASSRRLQDIMLGALLGAVNGYLIVGTIWYFLHAAGYGLLNAQPPAPGSAAELIALKYLAPAWMSPAILVVAMMMAVIFVLVVYL